MSMKRYRLLLVLLAIMAITIAESLTVTYKGTETAPSVWAGGVTHNEARFRVRGYKGNALAVSQSDQLVRHVNIDHEFQAIYISDLTPKTKYKYAVTKTRVEDVSGLVNNTSGSNIEIYPISDGLNNIGQFKTFPAPGEKAEITIGFGSCSFTGSEEGIYDFIRDRQYDLFIHLGDMHYMDIVDDAPYTSDSGVKKTRFDEGFDRSLRSKPQRQAYQSAAMVYMYDDHDSGPNNNDETTGMQVAATEAYRRNFPHYPMSSPRADDLSRFANYTGSTNWRDASSGFFPSYQAFTYGRIRFVVMDLRTEANNYGLRIMSDEQLDWVIGELSNFTNYDLIVLVSTQQYAVPDNYFNDLGYDTWGYAPDQRRRLADYISLNNIKNVIIMSADSHHASADRGYFNDFSNKSLTSRLDELGGPSYGGAGIPIIHGSPFDQFGSINVQFNIESMRMSQGCFSYSLWVNRMVGELKIYYKTDSSNTEVPCISFDARNQMQGNDIAMSMDVCAPFVVRGRNEADSIPCQVGLFPVVGWAVFVTDVLSMLLIFTLLKFLYPKTLALGDRFIFLAWWFLLTLLALFLWATQVLRIDHLFYTFLGINMTELLIIFVLRWVRLHRDGYFTIAQGFDSASATTSSITGTIKGFPTMGKSTKKDIDLTPIQKNTQNDNNRNR